jgi:hypothetical protein
LAPARLFAGDPSKAFVIGGQLYRNTTFGPANGNGVTVFHDEGRTSVALADLPLNVAEQLRMKRSSVPPFTLSFASKTDWSFSTPSKWRMKLSAHAIGGTTKVSPAAFINIVAQNSTGSIYNGIVAPTTTSDVESLPAGRWTIRVLPKGVAVEITILASK